MAHNKICTIDSCDKPAKARGWCDMHYSRWKRHGDPEAQTQVRRPPGLTTREAFEFFLIEPDANGCHIWPQGATAGGYSQLRCEGVMRYGHIVAYELYVGPIPPGYEIDHKCRVRRCVNPEHLRLATRKQNGENKGAQARSRTGIRGVRETGNGRFNARVFHDGVMVLDRRFDTIEEAEAAAIAARNFYFTHNDSDRMTQAELALAG